MDEERAGLFDRVVQNPLFNLGMGVLASNTGHYGAFAPALGRGAMLGMQNLQEMRQSQAMEDYRRAMQQKWEMENARAQRRMDIFDKLSGVTPNPAQVAGDTVQGGPGYLRQAQPDMLDALERIATMDGDSTLLLGVQRERRERALANPEYIATKVGIEEQAKAQYAPPIETKDPYGRTIYTPRTEYARQGGATGQAGPNPGFVEAISERNKQFLNKTMPDLTDQASTASRLRDSVRALREIDVKTGFGTEWMAAAANVLGALGVEDAAKYASDAQKFQSNAMTRLWEVLNAAKGPQTEGDADRAAKTYASLANTPEANAFIMDYMDATAELAQDKAKYFQGFSDRMLTPDAQDVDLGKIQGRWNKISRSIWDYPQLAKWRKYTP